MDKLLKSNWFVKIIAFLLALMLYTVLSMETQQQQANRESLLPTVSKTSETVNGVAITPYFDENKYVLTDLPKSVDVKLTGTSNLLTKAIKVDRKIEVYVDLTNLGPGTHRVPVLFRNLPKELDAEPSPKQVKVTLHRKQTKQVPVSVDIKNESKLPEGYETGNLEYSPKSVYVTGAEELIKDIATVEGTVDVAEAKDKVESRVPLRAYDSQGNLLDVLIDPKSVNVTVPITKPKKSVPLSINEKGELPKGLTLVGISMNPKEVTLTGPSSDLEKVDEVKGIDVDLSKIKEDSTIDVDVPLPKGVEAVDPKQVQVRVDVEKDDVNNDNDVETKTFQDIPIELRGEETDQPASFITPSSGKIDVTITGSKKSVDALSASDIKAWADVSGLNPGEHTISIKVSNSKNLQMKLEYTDAKVKIEESSTADETNPDKPADTNENDKQNTNSADKQSEAPQEKETIYKPSQVEEKSDTISNQ